MCKVALKEKSCKIKHTQNVKKKFGSMIKRKKNKKSKMYITYVLHLFAFQTKTIKHTIKNT